MNGVFSNYLKWAWPPSKPTDDNCLRSVIERMRYTYQHDEFHGYYNVSINPHIIIDSPLTRNEYNMPGTYTYECFNNDAFRSVISWININILLQMTKDTYITTEVKIRIATGMINKLVKQEKLNRDYGMLAHDILVANVAEIRCILIDEDLPF